MDAVEYQSLTRETAIYRNAVDPYASQLTPTQLKALLRINYLATGVAGEAGEVASLVKKLMRDNDGIVTNEVFLIKMEKELGDCMWYISELCNELGFTLSQIMEANIEKLAERKMRDTLQGSGDDR